MAVIESMRPAFYAPTRRRYFFTRKAAVRAEAAAIIMAKHPTERSEPEVGEPGWHWSELPRAEVLLRRMMRIVAQATPTPPADKGVGSTHPQGGGE